MAKVTVVFNNTPGDKRLRSGCGSSALIEEDGQLILFDTGSNAGDLLFNLKTLGIDIKNIHKIVISHPHPDHTGGLVGFFRENIKNIKRVELYLPAQYNRTTLETIKPLAGRIYMVEEKKRLTDHLHISSIKSFFGRENILVIDSIQGLILVIGCGHPGIYRISKTIKSDFDKEIYAIMGGLHFEYYPLFLVRFSADILRSLGVRMIGPNHCTGKKAIKVLREVFKEDFVHFGCGRSFEY